MPAHPPPALRALCDGAPMLMLMLAALLSACGQDDLPAVTEDMPVDMVSVADMGAPDEGVDLDARFSRPPGAVCDGPQQCVPEARCASQQLRFVCMALCEEPGRLCEGGEVCTSIAGGEAVCYPGGGKQLGEACFSNLDCPLGASCLGTDEERYCLRVCHAQDPDVCLTEQRCVVTSTRGIGVCRDRVGSSCADDACPEGLTCSSTRPETLDDLFTGETCTRFECGSDAACTNTSDCRPLMGLDGLSACLDRCDSDAECRFNVDMRCRGAEACDALEDATSADACREMFGTGRYCVGPLQ